MMDRHADRSDQGGSVDQARRHEGECGRPARAEWSRWAGVLLTALIAVLAFTVQWGVVTAKLDHVEKRLDELIVEARALRAEYQTIERRVSYLEGRQNGLPDRQAGRPAP